MTSRSARTFLEKTGAEWRYPPRIIICHWFRGSAAPRRPGTGFIDVVPQQYDGRERRSLTAVSARQQCPLIYCPNTLFFGASVRIISLLRAALFLSVLCTTAACGFKSDLYLPNRIDKTVDLQTEPVVDSNSPAEDSSSEEKKDRKKNNGDPSPEGVVVEIPDTIVE